MNILYEHLYEKIPQSGLGSMQVKKLRETTYTAAVCKFWGGGHFFCFGLVPSVAQLSSTFIIFLVFLRYSRYCH